MVQTPKRSWDGSLRAQPWAARVVGRVGHGAGKGYRGTAGTRRSSGPRLLPRGLRVVEALRGSTPGSTRLCVGAPRQARLPPASAQGRRGLRRSTRLRRCSLLRRQRYQGGDGLGVNLRRCRARQPLLRHDPSPAPLRERLDPTPFQRRNHARATGPCVCVGRRGDGPRMHRPQPHSCVGLSRHGSQ